MLLVGFLLTVINNRSRIDSHAMHDVVLGHSQSVSFSGPTATTRAPCVHRRHTASETRTIHSDPNIFSAGVSVRASLRATVVARAS